MTKRQYRGMWMTATFAGNLAPRAWHNRTAGGELSIVSMDDKQTYKTEIKGAGVTMPEHRKAGGADGRDAGPAYPIGAKITDSEGAVYSVEDGPFYGGMGRVYKVRHADWDIPLAMKQPLPGKYQSKEMQAFYEAECEAAVLLGYHPNIVTCYHVRDVEGLPSIFSEWMDGGTLGDAIRSARLYAGSEQEAQGRILMAAYDIAQGLYEFAVHYRVHGDVSPSNVLFAADGTAKISDMGAVSVTAYECMRRDSLNRRLDEGAAAYGGPKTPSYASPEQKGGGGYLTVLSDIYSFALVLLSAYRGELTGTDTLKAYGKDANGSERQIQSLLHDTRLPMHAKLKEFIRNALTTDIRERARLVSGDTGGGFALEGYSGGWFWHHIWQIIEKAHKEQLGQPLPNSILTKIALALQAQDAGALPAQDAGTAAKEAAVKTRKLSSTSGTEKESGR